jgi:hypothetical protein
MKNIARPASFVAELLIVGLVLVVSLGCTKKANNAVKDGKEAESDFDRVGFMTPPGSPPSSRPSRWPPAGLQDGPPAFRSTVENYVLEWKKDPAAAEHKYIDKFVAISGRVAEVIDSKNFIYVRLSNESGNASTMHQFTKPKWGDRVASLKLNTSCTINGVCAGSSNANSFYRCRLED